ncbi:Crp/Fnr family transcriptional regulator [Tamlana sp. 2_MG-2023]|uniref:Crp/Fnr family transcriptional regulator n=1 Tax=unclassified Tamlana TaxID=2614803 RepID=UPI0026E30AE9|nr:MULTISPECIES: Crp/Fnr family transcriptional regulator [unclassified Tamlana]MDO6758704.1 Crp/Fnr family transcriptional regulator [Tamlana sp. 2_MG-2023]MDO6789403.1 Crp/Fnr family transcriptional regulator [Tamlana sp. 1_MG-2023]
MSKCEQCIIKQFNSLKALTKDELVRISSCKTSHTIKKGAVIFEEGEVLNGVYCIKDGICKLSKLSENGKDQIVKMVVKGQLLGQRSLISEESSNLQATALNDMEVCFIPKSEIFADLQKNPKFSFEVLKDMAHDLRDSDDIIVNMAQKSVRQRLAETLIYIHENFGTNPDDTLSVLLSREDYAGIVGTATESAIRVLSQFKKEGLIEAVGKYIKIIDFAGLERVE